jgi:hypothetical protein
VRFFPVTVDDGIDVHGNASYFLAQGVRQLQLVSKFSFHSIAENLTSQMYEDEKGSSTFNPSVERVGHVCQFSAVKIQF